MGGRALLQHERHPEVGTGSHGGLRITRLHALVRLLDSSADRRGASLQA